MKIWISIGHIAQLNFYSNAVIRLSKKHEVFLTVLDRGKLLAIANKELGDIDGLNILPMGKHSGSKFSVIWDANLVRFFKMLHFAIKRKPEIAIGNGFIHGMVGKIIGIPVLMFSDDIERKRQRRLMSRFSDELYYVTGSEGEGEMQGIKTFKALKEWAYLSPKYFEPDKDALKEFGIEPYEYLFIREVITGTLNYKDQVEGLVAMIANDIPSNVPVILSLEDKSNRSKYPGHWHILEEPVSDIHSLIYFSRAVISSGDSMAREGAILAVPSAYCGVRSMKANDVMISKGRLVHVEPSEVPGFVQKEFNGNFDGKEREAFKKALLDEWIDVTEFISEKVESLKN